MDIVFLVLVIVTFTAMALEKYVLKPRRIRLYGSEADKYSNGFLNYIAVFLAWYFLYFY